MRWLPAMFTMAHPSAVSTILTMLCNLRAPTTILAILHGNMVWRGISNNLSMPRNPAFATPRKYGDRHRITSCRRAISCGVVFDWHFIWAATIIGLVRAVSSASARSCAICASVRRGAVAAMILRGGTASRAAPRFGFVFGGVSARFSLAGPYAILVARIITTIRLILAFAILLIVILCRLVLPAGGSHKSATSLGLRRAKPKICNKCRHKQS